MKLISVFLAVLAATTVQAIPTLTSTANPAGDEDNVLPRGRVPSKWCFGTSQGCR